MKKYILTGVNSLLRPFGAKVVKRSADGTDAALGMASMLQRLAGRGIPVRTVIDIGASDGKWSIACMEYFPEALYLAVEPLEERRKALESARRRFTSFDYAICAAGGVDGEEVSLNVTADLDGSTVDGQNPGVKRTCRIRTIDSLLTEKNLPGPYLLKFDTHGYEMPILSGCGDVLKNTTAIIMEVYNFQLTPTSLRFHDMCAHLERLGFRLADIAEPMLRSYDNAFWQIDMLFLQAGADVFQYRHYR